MQNNLSLRNLARWAVHETVARVPLSRNPSTVVLCWHTVNDGGPRSGYVSNRRSQPVEIFEKQISWLADNFDFVSIDSIASGAARKNSSRPAAAITFDDGYRDNLYTVLPVLEKYSAPITLFVATEYVDSQQMPWWDLVDWIIEQWGERRICIADRENSYNLDRNPDKFRADAISIFRDGNQERRDDFVDALKRQVSCRELNDYMIWDELREFQQHELTNIGAHTHSHINMAAANDAHKISQLEKNVEILHEQLRVGITTFAYPYGSAEQVAHGIDSVYQEIGISSAFSTIPGVLKSENDPFQLPRMIVSPRSTVASLKAALKLLYFKHR